MAGRAERVTGGGAAEAALELVESGQVLGLGSGRAASEFVRKLGERVAGGLKVQGVPTSQQTARLATECGIPLVDLADVAQLDTAFDGADEVDPFLDLIKGYGGALVREKVVAAMARRFVILIGPPSEAPAKMVERLGGRGRLPVEVVPFAEAPVRRALERLGLGSAVRQKDGAPALSDNGNLIVDGHVEPLLHPAGLERAIRAIPGVVGTGLFLGMADLVLVDTDAGLLRRARPGLE